MQAVAAVTGLQAISCSLVIDHEKICLEKKVQAFVGRGGLKDRNGEVFHGLCVTFASPAFLPRRKTSFTKISASEGEATVQGPAVEELTLEEPTVAEDTGPTVKVKFELQRECHFGQEFNVVGGDPQFGDWDPKAAKPMVWSEGHIWTLEVDVPEGRIIEFKYVLTGKDGEVDWQPGANYVLETIAGSPGLLISEPWTTVEEEAAIETAPVNPEPTIDKGILEVSSPGDASTDAAATATVGILNAGVKAVAAIVETLEGEEGSLVPPNGSNGGDVSSTGVATNGVDEDLSGQEETPTVPEIPVIDAALAVAAEEVRGDGKEAEDPAIID